MDMGKTMTVIKINGQEVEVCSDTTILQACEMVGIEIPRFCFHERLSIAGNCRMCLVEVKGGPPKPQASCAMAARDLRPGPNGEPPEIFTNTPMVKKARLGVMEFLLINHPLDCPICDQGGECDLQDQAMAYGLSSSRYKESKRAVVDKYIGPLVKTIMTRCIQCTRCVRFIEEVAGVGDLGLISRGEDVEITTYLEHAMSSELQGNIVDLCPVGALTSRPYAFTARPWELTKVETIDVMDALGSNIRVDVRGREVMRILPRLHEGINEEWISDKTRYVVDGLKVQRLDTPYIRKDGKLSSASWREALTEVAQIVKNTPKERIGIISGGLVSVEELYSLKILANQLGILNYDSRPEHLMLHPDLGSSTYRLNMTISGIEKVDALLIIGSNVRKEAPILNARFLKRWRSGELQVALIGQQVDLTYPYEHLGVGTEALVELMTGNLSFFETLKKAQYPAILLGEGAVTGLHGQGVLSVASQLAMTVGAVRNDWNGFNVLALEASRVGGLDIGFIPDGGGLDTAGLLKAAEMGELDVLFLIGRDEIDMNRLNKVSVVYLGTHGDSGAHRADIILPGAAYTEKSSIYVNTEGRVQIGCRATFPPGEAREDWAIFRALSEVLGVPLPWNTLSALRQHLYNVYPALQHFDMIISSKDFMSEISNLSKLGGDVGPIDFVSPVTNFYQTNAMTRASPVLAECAAFEEKRTLVGTK